MRVRVAGRWLHTFCRVSELRVRHGADGGNLEASATVTGSRSVVEHPVFRRGAEVEVFDGLRRAWLGRMVETPEETGTWRATGLFAEARRFLAVSTFDQTPTDDVDDALDQAVIDGLPFTYLGDAPANFVPNEEPQRLDALINAHATANSVRATVRGDGILRWETDPTVPAYVVLPGIGALSRADEDFATRVTVRYISSVSGTPPVADDYDTETVIDTAAETLHGLSALYVDITSRGLLTATEAGYVAQGILDKYGARLSFAGGVTVSANQLRHPGLARVGLGTVEAGRMVRFLGVRTPAHATTTAYDVVIGSVDYTDGSGQITLNPLGLVPRTLVDVIASVPTTITELNPAPGAGALAS